MEGIETHALLDCGKIHHQNRYLLRHRNYLAVLSAHVLMNSLQEAMNRKKYQLRVMMKHGMIFRGNDPWGYHICSWLTVMVEKVERNVWICPWKAFAGSTYWHGRQYPMMFVVVDELFSVDVAQRSIDPVVVDDISVFRSVWRMFHLHLRQKLP